MELRAKISSIINKPAVVNTQMVLKEVATGLTITWLVLMALEIWRPGIASIYLDLNLILVLALVAWFMGAIGRNAVSSQ